MYVDEHHYWKHMYTILFISILLWFIINPYDVKKVRVLKEQYTLKNKDLIGASKTVRVSNIISVAPHMGVILRDQVNTWIVNVPLHPFKSEVYVMPPLEKIPSFLLYDPSFLSPPRNQGDCGCCWAFALCDMLADRLRITTQGLFDHNLSVQQLITCATNEDGCNGGSPEDACIWLSTRGVMLATEQKIPFIQQSGGQITTTCEWNIPSSIRVGVYPNSVFSLAEFIPEHPTGLDLVTLEKNIINMKKQLVLGGPFYCAMTVYDDLFTFDGLGVYSASKGAQEIGGHAIEIIGYSEKGQDPRKGFEKAYWVCKNSWGSGWPTKSNTPGYFMIQMGVNMCGVESRSGVATPSLHGKYAQSTEKIPIDQMRYTSFQQYKHSL